MEYTIVYGSMHLYYSEVIQERALKHYSIRYYSAVKDVLT